MLGVKLDPLQSQKHLTWPRVMARAASDNRAWLPDVARADNHNVVTIKLLVSLEEILDNRARPPGVAKADDHNIVTIKL